MNSGINSPSIPPPTGIFFTQNFTFHVNGDTVTLNRNNTSDQKNNMTFNSYGTNTKFIYKIKSDTLLFIPQSEIKNDSSRLYLYFTKLSGTIRNGKWRFNSFRFENNKTHYTSDISRSYLHYMAYLSMGFSWIDVKNGMLTINAIDVNDDFSCRLLSVLKSDSTFSDYKIQTDSINNMRIRLIGKRTSDTVVIEKTNDSIVTFHSSDPSFEKHIFNSFRMCASQFYPPWYGASFLNTNYRYSEVAPPKGNFDRLAFAYSQKEGNILVVNTADCGCVEDPNAKKDIFQTCTYQYNEDSLHLTAFFNDSSAAQSCTVKIFLNFSRLSGTSLTGNYRFSSCSYIIAGMAGTRDSSFALSVYQQYCNSNYVWLQITDSGFNFFRMLPDIGSFTTVNRMQWSENPAFKKCDISFDSISPSSFRLIGNIAHDTVEIEKSTFYTVVYSYSDNKFPSYTFYENGRMRLTRAFPTWLNDVFFLHNTRNIQTE